MEANRNAHVICDINIKIWNILYMFCHFYLKRQLDNKIRVLLLEEWNFKFLTAFVFHVIVVLFLHAG